MKRFFYRISILLLFSGASVMGFVLLANHSSVAAASPSPDGNWGSITIGTNQVTLENSKLRAQYSQVTFGDGAVNIVITTLIDKDTNTNHAGGQIDGVWMGYASGRGNLTSATIVTDTIAEKKVRMEFAETGVIQEVSIFPDLPILKINYLSYGVNVVDIGSPGGTGDGTYGIYGAQAWQALRQTNTDPNLLNHANEHHRLTYDLYPNYPFPLIDTPDWNGFAPIPLNYNNQLIMTVFNNQSGYGYGRIYPYAVGNYLKLLWKTGFEMFPYWSSGHQPYVSYIFLGAGGENGLINLGKSVVDGTIFSCPNRPQGDVNLDCVVSAADILLLLSSWLGSGQCDQFACDFNNDGSVNAMDAAQLIIDWNN